MNKQDKQDRGTIKSSKGRGAIHLRRIEEQPSTAGGFYLVGT